MDEKCIINPERDCLGLIKANELEKDLTTLEENLGELRRQNSKSHERVFERLGELERHEGVFEEQYKNIIKKLDDLEGNLDEIKAKPAKQWEKVMEQVIGIVIAAVVGFMLAKMGLG